MDARAVAQLRLLEEWQTNSERYPMNMQRKALDVGFGVGSMLKLLESTYCIFGVEADPSMLDLAKSRLSPKATIKQASFRSEMFEARMFDVVVASHVLEHIRAPVEFLSGLLQLLRPKEGVLLLEVPNSTPNRVREIINHNHKGLGHLHFLVFAHCI